MYCRNVKYINIKCIYHQKYKYKLCNGKKVANITKFLRKYSILNIWNYVSYDAIICLINHDIIYIDFMFIFTFLSHNLSAFNNTIIFYQFLLLSN